MIEKSWKKLLYNQFRNISDEKDYGLDFINGVEDHIHLLMAYRPKWALSDIVKDFKGLTWQWARSFFKEEKELKWQNGFSAFSLSPDRVNNVRDYIKKQELHHATMGYDQEIKWLQKQSSK